MTASAAAWHGAWHGASAAARKVHRIRSPPLHASRTSEPSESPHRRQAVSARPGCWGRLSGARAKRRGASKQLRSAVATGVRGSSSSPPSPSNQAITQCKPRCTQQEWQCDRVSAARVLTGLPETCAVYGVQSKSRCLLAAQQQSAVAGCRGTEELRPTSCGSAALVRSWAECCSTAAARAAASFSFACMRTTPSGCAARGTPLNRQRVAHQHPACRLGSRRQRLRR